jgi:hypothetical protein
MVTVVVVGVREGVLRRIVRGGSVRMVIVVDAPFDTPRCAGTDGVSADAPVADQ